MPDGNVDHVDFVLREDVAHLRHETVEILDRDEVLLQHPGFLAAVALAQLADIVARLPVAPGDPVERVVGRIEYGFPHPLPEPAGI